MRLHLKRVSVILAGISLILLVMYSHSDSRQLSQRELIERMNVYDDFGRLSEERERKLAEELKGATSEIQSEKTNSISPRSHRVDYKKYTDVLALEKPLFLADYKNPCWRSTDRNSTKLQCLPYFHLLGVDKCGTTDLWARIKQHPELLQNDGIGGKETHWWSWRRFGFDIWVDDREPWSYDKYLTVFDSAASKIEAEIKDGYHPLITGEGSPTTFWDFTGWDRMPQNEGKTADNALLTPHAMYHLAPKTLFILIFRNPTERLYSDYIFLDLFRHNHNVSAENFHHDVKQSIQMYQDCLKIQSLKSCLYDKQLHMKIPVRIFVGMYAIYLKEWFQVFDKSQFLILQNEEYSKDVRQHISSVFKFLKLKIPADSEMDKIVSRERAFDQSIKKKLTGPMLEETRTILNNFYRQHNEDLAVLLNDQKYLWERSKVL